MKRVIYLLIALAFLLGISSTAFAVPPSYYYSAGYDLDPPRRFDAVGFPYIDTTDPMNRLQNMMEFSFVNGKEIHRDFAITLNENEPGGPAEYLLSIDVTYQRDMAVSFESTFITGNFTFRQEVGGEVSEYTGMVNGSIVFILPANMGISDPDMEVPAILLRFYSSDNSQWNWYSYLDTPNDDLVCCEEDNVDLIMYTDSMYHEHRPHIPSPRTQVDVAAGIGLSTIGIVVANALTKTSVFGSASFNGSFDPTSAGPSGQSPSAGTGGSQAPSGSGGTTAGTGGIASSSAATGTGTSAVGAVQSAPASAGASGSAGSWGNIFRIIKEFFRNLFINLRDMLTDEGRSYASGKLAETLSETEFGDISDSGAD